MYNRDKGRIVIISVLFISFIFFLIVFLFFYGREKKESKKRGKNTMDIVKLKHKVNRDTGIKWHLYDISPHLKPEGYETPLDKAIKAYTSSANFGGVGVVRLFSGIVIRATNQYGRPTYTSQANIKMLTFTTTNIPGDLTTLPDINLQLYNESDVSKYIQYTVGSTNDVATINIASTDPLTMDLTEWDNVKTLIDSIYGISINDDPSILPYFTQYVYPDSTSKAVTLQPRTPLGTAVCSGGTNPCPFYQVSRSGDIASNQGMFQYRVLLLTNISADTADGNTAVAVILIRNMDAEETDFCTGRSDQEGGCSTLKSETYYPLYIGKLYYPNVIEELNTWAFQYASPSIPSYQLIGVDSI